MTTTRSNAEDRWIDVAVTLTERNLEAFEALAEEIAGNTDSEEFYQACLDLAGV